MRVNLEDLTKYAYCPVFYQNNHPLVKESNPIIDILRVEAIYLWGRQLEVGYKINWQEAMNKWDRLWWTTRDLNDSVARKQCNDGLVGLKRLYDYYREDDRRPLATNFPYTLELTQHHVMGSIPLILCDPNDPRKLSLVDLGLKLNQARMTRNLDLRLASVYAEQVIGHQPTILEVLHFNQDYKLDHTRLFPTEKFQQNSRQIIASLLQSMQQQLFYPNLMACGDCSAGQRCTLP